MQLQNMKHQIQLQILRLLYQQLKSQQSVETLVAQTSLCSCNQTNQITDFGETFLEAVNKQGLVQFYQ